MSEDPQVRPDVIAAILAYLCIGGRSWYQIDRHLSGRISFGPYMAELKHLERAGLVRREGDSFYLVNPLTDVPPKTFSLD